MEMDLNIILAGMTFFILLGLGLFLYNLPSKVTKQDETPEQVDEAALPPEQAARNQRARMRANAARHRNTFMPDEIVREQPVVNPVNEPRTDAFANDAKIGAKKRAKMEAKAERKAAREAEEQYREEKKAQDQQIEEERKQIEELEKAEELRRLELEKKETEAREQQEHEEYLKMKAAFSVEGEGFDEEGENDGQQSFLQEFIQYIKMNKVVVIEDLSAHFKLKTQSTIDRITTLQAEGHLTGVVDDRGKFIYISQEELENVAKFIKQRGRVSITDLVECSNKLINLVPVSY